MSFEKGLIKGATSEDTSRRRSFLFFAAGIFASTGLDRPFTLRVPENGPIALNVPLDLLRLGSLSTRTTHPFYMARWNDLLRAPRGFKRKKLRLRILRIVLSLNFAITT